MNRQYWNALAHDYAAEVREISELDFNGALAAAACKLGGKKKTAVDFGCGPGAVTRTIAPNFNQTIGVDFSEELLDLARKRTSNKKIKYEHADLETSSKPRFFCDVAFCANVLISEDAAKRQKILRTISRNVSCGGHAVIIVPSLESQLRIFQTLMQCEVEAGIPPKASLRAVDRVANTELVSLAGGIFLVGGTPTKHYLADELQLFLAEQNLNVQSLERIEYPWDEELEDLPENIAGPNPWDWMAVCVKA